VPEGFVPLASFLRGEATHASVRVPADESPPPVAPLVAAPPHADILSELARMRLFALEAFERGVESLLASFARDVLARELAIAPADLTALASQAVAAFQRDEPLRLVVGPADAARVTSSLPVRVDPSLQAGDLVVEVATGAFESPLAFRLASALEASLAFALRRSA
jgi:flagellar biosynthesis/type III secretory pathway protein FliH